MSRSIISSLLFALLLSGCRSETDAPVEQLASRVKPIVTLVPVIDSTQENLGWSLSDELTSAIDYRLSCNENLYLVDLKKTAAQLKQVKASHNPFGTDLSWLKKSFPKDEFVAFLELIQHDEILRQDKKNPVDPAQCAADLNLGLRLRIFDLRQATPRIVLQELVTDSHFIPRPFTRLNFQQVTWGEESFNISPVGLAHEAFAKMISKRIEDYVLINQ